QVFKYDLLFYKSENSHVFGIISLYSSPIATDPEVFLHFHRSTSSMPTDRIYEDGLGRLHSHYYASDIEEFIQLFDGPRDRVHVKYTSAYEDLYITRDSVVRSGE
ncbi:MAG: hypothetical protein MJA83_19660, partial [Gammaproteobacteria bacterium]|nr:hypothetical protein [Gammaproteobacteria bacterium]